MKKGQRIVPARIERVSSMLLTVLSIGLMVASGGGLAVLMAPISAHAQYPGSPTKKPAVEAPPKLRSTAVLEWIGEPGKPSASRIVPIAVWDGARYQAGGLYLAQPAPLAVMDETEYELQQAGIPQGRFVIYHPGEVNRVWFGYGAWHPLIPRKVSKLTPSKIPPRVVTEANSDKVAPTEPSKKGETPTPVPADSPSSKKTTPAGPGDQQDADRPTLHKRSAEDTSDTSSASTASSDAKTSADSKAGSDDVDPDRPTLRKRPDKATVTAAAAAKAANTAATERDPDRPTLHRGAPMVGDPALQASKLVGMPADLQQMAAISDSTETPDHPFLFQWANPEDAGKMKAALEDIARKAIAASGVGVPSRGAPIATASVTHRATKAGAAHKTARSATLLPLADENFKAFELSYSGGATLVLTARSGEGEAEKDVTVIAQPDFYGVPHVLLQEVSDAAHLDMTPRMRFVDVADTDGDNRAELIFELRGETDRQFAIYKVARGRAAQVFLTERLPFGTTRTD